MPLSRLLDVVASSSTLRFHYATVPDVLISASCDNAPLLPVLDSLLHQSGFKLQRARDELFVIPLDGTDGWHYWGRSSPPPATWVGDSLVTVSPGMAGVPGLPGNGNASDEGWAPANLRVETARPGIGVLLPAAPGGSFTSPWYTRWPLQLRHVPRQLRLLLRVPAETTLFANGAPVLRHFEGTRVVDLSGLLHEGSNMLALTWARIAATAVSPGESFPVPESDPSGFTALLHYEWFVDDSMRPGPPPPTPASPLPQPDFRNPARFQTPSPGNIQPPTHPSGTSRHAQRPKK